MDLETVGTPGLRVRIDLGERDHHGSRSLWSAILDELRRNDAMGATVVRGVAGFGAHSRIHTASILELSSDLPLVCEWIDTPQTVERLLPAIEQLLTGGMITIEPLRIVRYQPHPS
jgi:PII-like signaling protein